MTTNPRPLRAKGGCLCGAVRYEIRGNLRPVVACHCSQCRRTTGHFMAATAAELSDFELTESRGLKWYRSSPAAQRGFCAECGSVLFWQGDGRDYIAIAAGGLDLPTGLRISEHIFTADKGDYYAIDDGLPAFEDGGPVVPAAAP